MRVSWGRFLNWLFTGLRLPMSSGTHVKGNGVFEELQKGTSDPHPVSEEPPNPTPLPVPGEPHRGHQVQRRHCVLWPALIMVWQTTDAVVANVCGTYVNLHIYIGRVTRTASVRDLLASVCTWKHQNVWQWHTSCLFLGARVRHKLMADEMFWSK